MSFRHGGRRIRNPLPEGLARQYAHHSQGGYPRRALCCRSATSGHWTRDHSGCHERVHHQSLCGLHTAIGRCDLSQKVSTAIWGAVALATVGMGVLALDPSTLGSGFGIGQLLTLASAVAYAGHIVATGRFANPSNVTSLGLYQTITVAIVCTIAALPGGLSAPTHMEDWLALAYLAIICGTLTTFMQSWGQARVESTRAAVIMCTEPLWGAVFAIGLGGEPLTGRITIGGIAILAAMALVVRPPRRRRGAPQHHTEPPVVQVDPAWTTRFGTDRML